MLQPILVLIIWTLIMFVWLYAKRIPAMQKAKIAPDKYKLSSQKRESPLPPDAVAVADNYNHLHESPTIFYALALLIHAAGVSNSLLISLAWVYVALRVCHSLVQANQGKVMIRFSLFAISVIVLMIMTANTAMALF